MRARWFFSVLFCALLALHLCHARVLWTEEELPIAAALHVLRGEALYRDVWFDKPPLTSFVYLLWGAKTGFVLRFFGAVYVWLCSCAAWLLARRAWGRREAFAAAALVGFVLTFDVPSAVIPLAADLLLVLPHLACIWLCFEKKPLWAGVAAGVGFLFNVKAAIVLAVGFVFVFPSVMSIAAGFVCVNFIVLLAIWLTGTFHDTWQAYVDQVWIWPAVYAGSSHVAHPVANAMQRTLNWAGFHAAIVIAALYGLWKMRDRARWVIWLCFAIFGVALGMRFFPRYFFFLLVPVTVLSARGFVLLPRRAAIVVASFLLIPLIRFGPRYPILALNLDPNWADLAMDRDSERAAEMIRAAARSGDTLYVWGYRPDIYIYSGLPAASRYLDCQAMTGVPADRHLYESAPVTAAGTAAARKELARSNPAFIADGLSLYNPRLAIGVYPELTAWMDGYEEIGRTAETVVWRRMGR